MADGTIGVTEGVDKLLDTTELTVGVNTVHRERIQIAGDTDVEIVEPWPHNFSPNASYGLLVRQAAPASTEFARSTATVAPGGTASLDSTALALNFKGRLVKVSVSSPQPWEADLLTVLNGTEQPVIMTFHGHAGKAEIIDFPIGDWVSVTDTAGAGFTGFRVNVTNCDTGAASSDIFATFFWSEFDTT